MKIDVEDCERLITQHNGEKIYVLLGKDLLMVKFAHENSVENEKLRGYIDAICDTVTKRLIEKGSGNEL